MEKGSWNRILMAEMKLYISKIIFKAIFYSCAFILIKDSPFFYHGSFEVKLRVEMTLIFQSYEICLR